LQSIEREEGVSGVGREAVRSLHAMFAQVMWQLDEGLLGAHGISFGEFDVLAELTEVDGGVMRLSDLAERVCLSRSALSRRVDSLERAGLVDRRNCPTDKRGTFAALTEEGRVLAAASRVTHDQVVERVFLGKLSAAELQGFFEAARAVTRGAATPQCSE